MNKFRLDISIRIPLYIVTKAYRGTPSNESEQIFIDINFSDFIHDYRWLFQQRHLPCTNV